MVIYSLDGVKLKYSLMIARPTSDAAVIWLEDCDSKQRWFCNVPFESLCRFSTSAALAAMPLSVLGMIQDADRGRKPPPNCIYPVHCCVTHFSAYCITLQLKISLNHADQKKGPFNAEFQFPMLPDTPATIRDREDLSPLAAFPVVEVKDEEAAP